MMDRRQFLATASLTAGLASLGACSRTPPPEGLLRVAMDNMPDHLDPARGQFAASALFYKQIHAPLTDYSADGGVGPGLAQRWFVSEDGLTWRIELRDDLRWSDGVAITAEDIVWSARRLVDPTQSFAALGDFFTVQHAAAVLAGERSSEDLGVRAIDSRTVDFQLSAPLGLFPVLMREFYPFPRHVIEQVGEDWARPEYIVSSGPYRLAHQSQYGLRLIRNSAYHAADQVSIPAIQADAVIDANARVRLFRAGEYDLVAAPPSNLIPQLQNQLGDGFASFDAPILRYLKLNHAREDVAQLALRRALSLSIDRAFLAETVFSGTAAPTQGVLAGDRAAAPDLNQARALLETVTLDRPLEIRATTGDSERLAVALAADWQRIGVATDILVSYPTDLYQAVDGGAFDIAVSSFNRGLKSDPFFMLDPFEPGGFAANFGWNDPMFAELMRTARRQSDPASRAEIYGLADSRLLEEQAIIPLVHERAHWLIANRLAGTRPDVQPQLWRDLSLNEMS